MIIKTCRIFFFLQAFFLIPCFTISHLHAAKPGKQVKKQEEPKKPEPKIEFVERIRLVFKYGNSSQIRDSFEKMNTLKEDEQKSLVPQIKELLKNHDPIIEKSVLQCIGDLKWNDLDDSVVKFLDSSDEIVVTTAANIIRKKNIKSAAGALKEKILKADYTVHDNRLNDFIKAFAVFKDSSIRDFMFDLLKKPEVLKTYKGYILKYLSQLDGSSDDIRKYLMDIVGNEAEDMNIRANSVRALGNMDYSGGRELFRSILEKIDSLSDMDKKRESFPLRLELISALVKLKDENVKVLLVQMTRDDDELVRLRAIRRLAEFKSNEFIDLLEYKVKYDSSLKIQKEAKKALDIIRGISTDSLDDDS